MHQLVTHTLATDWQQFTDKLGLRADSFLARLPDEEFAAEMVNLGGNLIAVIGAVTVRAVRQATSTIPIVCGC